jgi:hypothetical protein
MRPRTLYRRKIVTRGDLAGDVRIAIRPGFNSGSASF